MQTGIGIGVTYQQRGGASDAIASALATRAGIDWRPELYATTLFTDTAGTVAATGPGDVIAVQKSPSKAGLQFQQTTLANRPILVRHPKRGRVNRITRTEEFDNAAWTNTSATVTANTQVAPDGTTTADTVADNNAGAVFALITHQIDVYTATVMASLFIKKDATPRTTRFPLLRINYTGGAARSADVMLDTSTGATSNTSSSATVNSFGVVDEGDYWRLYISATDNGGNNSVFLNLFPAVGADASWVFNSNIQGSVVVWGAQLEAGTTLTAYQKVVSTYDITESGQASCWGLFHDGVNDSMATAATLDLSGSDKVGVFMGVQKLSDASRRVLIEHTASVAANNGGFLLTGPDGASATYGFESKGTVLATASGAGLAAPNYSVLSGFGDIGADGLTLRRNGASIATAVTDQGAGNFANATVYKGARGGSSLYESGIDWGGCVVSGLTTADAAIIAAIEAQLASNTPGVTL